MNRLDSERVDELVKAAVQLVEAVQSIAVSLEKLANPLVEVLLPGEERD